MRAQIVLFFLNTFAQIADQVFTVIGLCIDGESKLSKFYNSSEFRNSEVFWIFDCIPLCF